MPTRAQQFKSDSERHASASARPTDETIPHEPHGHVEKKAAYAHETAPEHGRPSRRSTRKSANHTKTDTGVVRAEQMKANTPAAQFARTDAHARRGTGERR